MKAWLVALVVVVASGCGRHHQKPAAPQPVAESTAILYVGIEKEPPPLAATFDVTERFFTLDLNGDHRTDLLLRDPQGGFRLWVSDGARLQPAQFGGTKAYWKSGLSDALGWGDRNRIFVVDLNGDGKDDLVTRSWDGSFGFLRSNGTSLTKAACQFDSPYSDEQGADEPNRIFFFDFTGDGQKDMVTRTADGVLHLWRNQTRDCPSFVLTAELHSGFTDQAGFLLPNRFAVVDANNDGLDDLLARDAHGVIEVYFSADHSLAWGGEVADTGLDDGEGWSTGKRWFVADIDGDSMKELLFRDPLGVFRVWRMTDGAYVPAAPIASPFTDEASNLGGNRLFIADLSGSRHQRDLVFITRLGGGPLELYRSSSGSAFQPE